jgi:uncharacterized circularly permuted ATP-grasp superfamily protein
MERSTRARRAPAGLSTATLTRSGRTPAYDEMFAGDETVRQAYRRLHDQLGKSAPAELGARAEALDRAFVDQGITFSLSGQERPFPRRRVRAHPRGWIAQPVVQLSTLPTKVGQRLRPRHVDLRPFAVNDGNSVFVLPGGLTRVAIPEGSLIVNSSQGGGSKDTWVLAAPFVHTGRRVDRARP